MSKTALRIAWFSALNSDSQPGSTVSAYVSDLLLPIIRQHFDVDVFSDGFRQYKDFPTYNYLSAFLKHRRQPYDIVFYQLEDHPAARFLRIPIGLLPGVVWFHDLYYRDRGPEPILNSPWREQIRFFNSGKWESAHCNWPDRKAEEDWPDSLGLREAAWALLAIFSEPFAQREFNNRVSIRLGQGLFRSGQDNYYMPYPVQFSDLRRSHSADNELRLCYAGSPFIEYRAHKFLQALSEQKSGYHLIWMISDDELLQAERMIKEFEISKVELVVDRSPSRWREIVKRSDLAVHCHYSMYGQPGVYLAISLAAGLPAIVTRFRSSENFPEGLLFFADPGVQESSQIALILNHFRQVARRVDTDRIVEMAKELFDHKMIAEQLIMLFEAYAHQSAKAFAVWRDFSERARCELIRETHNLLGSRGAVDAVSPASGEYAVKMIFDPVFKELGWRG